MKRWQCGLTYACILFCACIGFIVVVEDDAWVKQRFEQYMNEAFAASLQCQFTASLSQLQLIRGVIELEHVVAQPNEQLPQWQWHAQSARVTFSWLDVLFRGRFVISVQAEHVYVDSYTDASYTMHQYTMSLMSHMASLDQEPVFPMPVEVQSFQFYDSYISLYQSPVTKVSLAAHIDAQSVHDVLKVSVRPYNGTVMYSGHTLVSDISGLMTFSVDNKDLLHHALCDMHMRFLPDDIEHGNDAVVTGIWRDGGGVLYVDNTDDSLTGWASFDGYQCTSGDIYIPIVYPIAFFTTDIRASGTCHVQWERDEQNGLCIKAGLNGGTYKGVVLPQIYTQCNMYTDMLHGTMLVGMANETYLSCSGTYDSQGYISGSANMVRPITVGDMTISSGCISGSGDINSSTGSVHAEAGVMRPGDTYYIENPVHIDASLTDHTIECVGVYDAYTCTAHISDEKQAFYIRDLYVQQGDYTLAAMTGTPDNAYDIKVDVSLLQRVFAYTTEFSLRGDGDIYISGVVDSYCFTGDIHTQQLRIYLPMTYQLIEGVSGSIAVDPFEQRVTASDVCCQLYKGLLCASRVDCAYDWQGVRSLYAPVRMHDVFLHWKRDVFLQASGVLIMQYSNQGPFDLGGVIQIDQSYARGNPFSSELQRLFLTSSLSPHDTSLPDVFLHLHILTGTPLEIDTPFLQAAAHIDGSVAGYASQPGIEGTVTFLHGSLLFPYQPLYITKGSLTVVPHQPDDMFIDLVARNTIKQYDISLYVDGPLSDPHVAFESLPLLDKEQIVTLLMGGSEDGSLYFMMPKLVADSVEDLIFGSADTVLGVKDYIQRIFRPFRNIRFIPGFSDQSARGGLRGSLSIEVNERLRAFIQKNFSLSEDAAFEVSYLVSDDTNIRLLKDERGDLGGEVETRWRF